VNSEQVVIRARDELADVHLRLVERLPGARDALRVILVGQRAQLLADTVLTVRVALSERGGEISP
jgi:hypothetical protein